MRLKMILGFALGPIAGAVLGVITLPLMAWAFRPEDLGRMNMLQVVLSFCLLLTVLGLDQAYVREFHGSADHPTLLKACFLPGFILLIICALLSVTFASDLAMWLFDVADPLVYAATLFCVMINYISRFLSLILRMQERGLAFSMSQVIPKVLQLVLLTAVMFFGVQRNFTTLLWIIVSSMSAVVLIFAWNTRWQWLPAITASLSLAYIQPLIKFGTPLVFSGLAYWGLTTTSTVILRSQSNMGELGVYAVTSSIAGVAAIFQSIFSVVWAPSVYKWVSEGVDMSRIDRIANQALAVVCSIFVLVGCLSWLIDYILPQHYSNVKYLVICAISPPLLYTLSEITCVGIGITRRTGLTIWITIAALLVNVVTSYWLIPTQGAAGAVIANAVAYMVFFIGRTEVSARVWRQFSRSRLYIHTFALITLAISTVCFGALLPFHYAFVWLLALPIASVSFEDELLELFSFVKR